MPLLLVVPEPGSIARAKVPKTNGIEEPEMRNSSRATVPTRGVITGGGSGS